MNRLEENAMQAILALVAEDEVLTTLEAVAWDTEIEAKPLPRIAVKITQGDEMVYRQGVYALGVMILLRYRAKDAMHGDYSKRLETLLQSDLDAELTTDHFHCFGRSTGISTNNSPDADGRRVAVMALDIVGYDLDRFALVDEGGNAIDFGGGVTVDISGQ